jgi:hypothetical protein
MITDYSSDKVGKRREENQGDKNCPETSYLQERISSGKEK